MDMRVWGYFDWGKFRAVTTCGQPLLWLSSAEYQEHLCVSVDASDWSRLSSCSNWDSRHVRIYGFALEQVCEHLRPTPGTSAYTRYRTPGEPYPEELVADVGQASARW
eukprot:CAMPEP_0171125000 /NCGR_PEP_ID=MMETSP0766_2-20121228/110357_1 /TAXON_ID=439317 /ORGANISM="Gambierdiscus australes, Strain CAWD 149" /LENGTH=107 /DNA_ID=CAMNT_0011587959 /DNA_START=59 /DNA_END=379 /DNA_ORIENTATION=-